jgi:hypothetical protein
MAPQRITAHIRSCGLIELNFRRTLLTPYPSKLLFLGHFCCKIAASRHTDGTLVAVSRRHLAGSPQGLPDMSTVLECLVDRRARRLRIASALRRCFAASRSHWLNRCRRLTSAPLPSHRQNVRSHVAKSGGKCRRQVPNCESSSDTNSRFIRQCCCDSPHFGRRRIWSPLRGKTFML